MKRLLFLFLPVGILFMSGCGIVKYPGQPGVVTNQYSKIDLEDLEPEGLYVYETVYDNRVGGNGVGAVITKLYPKAKTFTSNVRTNADGTLYRNKAQYDGAEVQMISVPSLNQIHMNPKSTVQLLIDYKLSLDEIDDKNIAEEGIFKNVMQVAMQPEAYLMKKFRLDLLRAGKLMPNGALAYEVTGAEAGDKKFTPAESVKIETNFFQNSVRTSMTAAQRNELVAFIETNFPKGYQGKVNLLLKGAPQPMPVQVGVHTVKTAIAAGVKVIPNGTNQLAEDIVAQYSVSK